MPEAKRADLPTGLVMIRGLFGVESAHCNLFGWPLTSATEPAKEEPAAECRFPGRVARVELVPSGLSIPCCGPGGAVDAAQQFILHAYNALGSTECPGGGDDNPKECCAVIEAGQAALLEALEKLAPNGCGQ